MSWTPIHAALGQTGTTLTAEMIDLAVSQGLEETAQIDWKQKLPSDFDKGEAREEHQMELAKDAAAMANGDGGVIVYGVRERGSGSSAAGEVVPVGEVDDDVQRDVRMAINALTYPAVTGIELQTIRWPGEEGKAVLALHVPASEDAPHLIHPKKGRSEGWFQAPWRDGAHTRWMSERQIADAYRRREQGRRLQQESFEALYNGFIRAVGAAGGTPDPVWVIAAAQPVRRPVSDRAPVVDDFGQLIRLAKHASGTRGISVLEEMSFAETRVGLRCLYRTGSRNPSRGAVHSRIELHHDGGVVLGLSTSDIVSGDEAVKDRVSVVDLEAVARQIAALVWKLTSGGAVLSDYRVRLGVAPQTSAFVHPDPFYEGEVSPLREQDRIFNHRPVDGLLVTQMGDEALASSASDFVTDVLQQVGVFRSVRAQELLAQWRAKPLPF